MRKTQIALAAVALVASSAALADVKVAGCVDAAVVNTSAGTVLGGGGDGCASQWGIYGSEDIGGLKASFNLETGFSTANGALGNGGNASNTGFFNRLANVGLGTKEATVTLGMAKSAWIEAAAGGLTAYGMNGVGVPALALLNPNLSAVSQATGGFFIANLAGVSGDLGVASYNLQSTVNPAAASSGTATVDNYQALRVSAPVGPGSVNYGYENRKNTPATTDINISNWTVSGSLPLDGGLSLNAAYAKQTDKVSTADQTGYLLGVGYKLSDAIGVGATYARSSNSSTDVSRSMMALSAQYNFSAKTALYANYVDFTRALALNNGGAADAPTNAAPYSGNLISVGAQHAF